MQLIERFGAAPPRPFVGVYAGTNPQNKNAMGFLDLDAANVSEIVDADGDALRNAVSGTPKLIRSVSINKAPNVFPITNPEAEHVAAAKLVAARPDFLERVGQALADRFADWEEPQDVEKQIFSGFYSAADKHILQKFEHVGWHHRAELIANLEDHRLRQLGQRLIYWNAPELVSDHYVTAAHAAIRDRWMSKNPNVPWTTMLDVEQQLDEIAGMGVMKNEHLSQLRLFYQNKLGKQTGGHG